MLRIQAVAWPCPWDDLIFGTMTYPGYEAPEFVPRDGRVVKNHRRELERRYLKKWGVPLQAFWKLEFQPREGHPDLGPAPHLHYALVPPWVGVLGRMTPAEIQRFLVEFRVWLAQTWFDIVGSGSAEHLKAGTQAVFFDHDPSFYFSCYVSKDKDRQHEVPEWFEHVGRFWGVVGGLRVHRGEVEVTECQMVTLNRTLRKFRWRRHVGARLRRGKRPTKSGVPKGRKALRAWRKKKRAAERESAYERVRDPRAWRDRENRRLARRRVVMGVGVFGGACPLDLTYQLLRVLGDGFASGFVRFVGRQRPGGVRAFRSGMLTRADAAERWKSAEDFEAEFPLAFWSDWSG